MDRVGHSDRLRQERAGPDGDLRKLKSKTRTADSSEQQWPKGLWLELTKARRPELKPRRTM